MSEGNQRWRYNSPRQHICASLTVMTRDSHTEIRKRAWELKIPELIFDLYWTRVRVYPHWKRAFPHYLPPQIKDAIRLDSNTIRITTGEAEYTFCFHERSTVVADVPEFVKTGELSLQCGDALVFRIGVSPPDSQAGEAPWTPRYIETFVEGPWVEQLAALAPHLRAHEQEQFRLEEQKRREEAAGIAALKARFNSHPPHPVRRSWFRRWFGL